MYCNLLALCSLLGMRCANARAHFPLSNACAHCRHFAPWGVSPTNARAHPPVLQTARHLLPGGCALQMPEAACPDRSGDSLSSNATGIHLSRLEALKSPKETTHQYIHSGTVAGTDVSLLLILLLLLHWVCSAQASGVAPSHPSDTLGLFGAGEWGGTNTGSDATWEMAFAAWLVQIGGTDQFYWCLNPTAGDTQAGNFLACVLRHIDAVEASPKAFASYQQKMGFITESKARDAFKVSWTQ